MVVFAAWFSGAVAPSAARHPDAHRLDRPPASVGDEWSESAMSLAGRGSAPGDVEASPARPARRYAGR
ncbi:hypothetical protein [Actinoalloteichus hymeniacidonis]|uniref:hypothetical protein n=1 Tax=Actinoalloteichus hymeniacidonis TaxID=340345 RepID=UPI0012F72FE5|nr:hypothetical protein [Actinoalloteichus hymeniacidonis]MBB5906686.1 hypothetical protein [Actinoalloteichus hymeniacidonis]